MTRLHTLLVRAGLTACALVAGIALLHTTAPASPTVPLECTLPGVNVAVDPTGDQDATIGTAQDDIQAIWMSQATSGNGPSPWLVVTMKVATLDPNNLPVNHVWRVLWTNPADAMTYFVSMLTCDVTNQPSFDYGFIDPTTGVQTSAGSSSGVISTDGNIQVTVARGLVGNPTTGAQLNSINGTTQLLAGAQCTGSFRPIDSAVGGTYTISNACSGPPPPPSSRCIIPGIALGDDPTGDVAQNTMEPADDLTEVWLAEPYNPDGVERIEATIRVAGLNPAALPLDRLWRVYFTVPTDPETTFFMGMNTCRPTAPLGPTFDFGYIDVNTQNLRRGLGNADSGYVLPNEIRVVMSKHKVGNNSTAGDVLFHVLTGVNINNILATTDLLAGGNCTGLLESLDQLPSPYDYFVAGNGFCKPHTVSCPANFNGSANDGNIPKTFVLSNPSTATRNFVATISDVSSWVVSGGGTTPLTLGPGASANLPVTVRMNSQCTPTNPDPISFVVTASDLPTPDNNRQCSTIASCSVVGVGDGVRTFSFGLLGSNPIRGEGMLAYTLAERSPVRIEVFGVDGRRVRTLVNRVEGPGSHSVPFRVHEPGGRGLGAGVYLVRITAGNEKQSLRLVALD